MLHISEPVTGDGTEVIFSYNKLIGAVAHLARAFEWHSKGSGFKSHQLQSYE